MDIRVEAGTCAVADHVDEICDLYTATFSEPPFIWTDQHADEHKATLADLRRDPTFDATVATAQDRVVGFAYGHRLPVDHGWWGGFPVVPAPEITAEWEGRTFALIDLAVAKQWRGRGIGQLLLSELAGRRQEERIVLSVQPTAIETQQIYVHFGWRKIGRKGPIEEVTPPYWDIFLLPLPPTTGWRGTYSWLEKRSHAD